MWSLEAFQGYNNGVVDLGASCCRIVILLATKWSKMVSETSLVLNNHTQFTVLYGLPRGDLDLINIYAPNESIERVLLWESLMLVLPLNCRWLIARNFNFVEFCHDKMNSCSRLVSM